MLTEAYNETEARLGNATAIAAVFAKAFRPKPSMTLVQWADERRRLSTVASAFGGRWRTSRFEIARGPMLATTEPGVETITCMVATQTLKTELLLNIIGYHADLDPCPMLLVQPKEDAAEIFSKERLAPMIRATPALAVMADDRVRGGRNTIRYKEFPGGFLAMAYAGSPTELAMRPIRIALMDEIDKYETTKEGDPVLIAEERTATFRANRLKVRVCSPTWEETSRVAKSYGESDQRKPFVACPHCGHWQTLDFFRNVHWPKTPEGGHLPAMAALFCEACGVDGMTRQPIEGKEWDESQRLRMVTTPGAIRWHQCAKFTCCGEEQEPEKIRRWRWDEKTQVGLAECSHCGNTPLSNKHAGFHASKLYSPVTTIPEIAEKWIAAKDDPESKQVFYNTQLAIPFALQAMRRVEPNSLMARREKYEHQVPEGVLVLTAGVDVQSGGSANEGRLEIEVTGWGMGFESWSIDYSVLEGDPATLDLWKRLDEHLAKLWKDWLNRGRGIEAVCIDTGGHSTESVYRYCAGRVKRNVWGIKGRNDMGGVWSPVWPAPQKYDPKKFRTGYRPIMIGVNAAKEAVRELLLVEEHGVGFQHFPLDRPNNYFEQLTSEKLLLEYKDGKAKKFWKVTKGQANEALDARVYSYAALRGLMFVRKFDFARRAEMLAAIPAVADDGKPVAAKAAPPPKSPIHRSEFMR